MTSRIEFLVSAAFDPFAIMVQPILLTAGEASTTTTPDLARARQAARVMAESLGCDVVDTCAPPATATD